MPLKFTAFSQVREVAHAELTTYGGSPLKDAVGETVAAVNAFIGSGSQQRFRYDYYDVDLPGGGPLGWFCAFSVLFALGVLVAGNWPHKEAPRSGAPE